MDFVRRIMRDSRQHVVEGSTEFSGFETLLRDFLLTLNVCNHHLHPIIGLGSREGMVTGELQCVYACCDVRFQYLLFAHMWLVDVEQHRNWGAVCNSHTGKNLSRARCAQTCFLICTPQFAGL